MPNDVTVTVPADHAALFKREATIDLEAAVRELDQVERLDREGHLSKADILDDCRTRTRTASRVWAQVEGKPGELRVEAERKAIANTIRGCLLAAADEVKGVCELRWDAEFPDKLRHALAEVEMWLGMLESVGGEGS